MKKELQTAINEIERQLTIAENTLSYCEMDMDRKGLRDIPKELRDMYKRALTERKCYAKVLKLLLTLSDNVEE